MNTSSIQSLIKQLTKVSRVHLTPEIGLHLITPQCHLWNSRFEESPFDDPFWAFYWPGGQALSRYILDNKKSVQGKSVLDVGSGCGAASIAAVLSGAAKVTANDIDEVSSVAIAMNKKENLTTEFDISTDNLLSQPLPECVDVVLMGDMFYDPDFAHLIHSWLLQCTRGTTVLIGDPDRLPFINHPLKRHLELVASYELPATTRLENNGLTHGKVWMYKTP